MQSVGEKLKNARLEKNISLDEVYQQTKIHPQVLEALEQDRAHNFLSLLYVKGFLRTYAQYLGINSEELIKEYLQSQKPQAAHSSIEVPVEKEEKLAFKIKPLLILKIISIIILSVILVFSFRFLLQRLSHFHQANQQKVKVEVLLKPKVTQEELALEVGAKENCWLRVTVDNQIMFEGILSKGKRELWLGKEKIELRIGKPEALEVFFNGDPVELKKKGVKKGLVVTQKGIQGK